jgi:hypothetical protein
MLQPRGKAAGERVQHLVPPPLLARQEVAKNLGLEVLLGCHRQPNEPSSERARRF